MLIPLSGLSIRSQKLLMNSKPSALMFTAETPPPFKFNGKGSKTFSFFFVQFVFIMIQRGTTQHIKMKTNEKPRDVLKHRGPVRSVTRQSLSDIHHSLGGQHVIQRSASSSSPTGGTAPVPGPAGDGRVLQSQKHCPHCLQPLWLS